MEIVMMLIISVAVILFAFFLVRNAVKPDILTAAIQRISTAIKEKGAKAFLTRVKVKDGEGWQLPSRSYFLYSMRFCGNIFVK